MQLSLEVKLRGGLFEGPIPRIESRIGNFVAAEAEQTKRDVQEVAPVDLGLYQGSIRWLWDKIPTLARVTSETVEPVIVHVIEYGRRAGARMPPPGVLVGWMYRHGWEDPVGDEFVLRRSIAEKGIAPKRPFGQAYDKLETRLGARVVNLEQEIAATL